MASLEKKAKGEVFSKEELATAFQKLCSTDSGSLASLTIKECNAAFEEEGYGKLFSQAQIAVRTNKNPGDKLFYFGSIFLTGFKMLQSYLDNPEFKPSDGYLSLILSKLLSYLDDVDDFCVLKSQKEKDIKTECDLAVRLAEHLFAKLCPSSSYTLDKYYGCSIGVQQCNCGCGSNISAHYGDTSIGNLKVWHGCLDIVLDSFLLSVAVIEGKTGDSPGGESSTEVDIRDNLETADVKSQLLAQTIVFSFTQKKKHPEYSHFLIPSIGVNKNKIIFHFYDSEHDILFKTPSFDITTSDGLQTKVSLIAVLATWFVVNYNYLCTGLTEEMLKDAKKAKFYELAKGKLPVYQNYLTIGGIPRDRLPVGAVYQPWHVVGCVHGELPENLIKMEESKKESGKQKL